MATPIPPPMHRVASPRFASRFCISWSRVTKTRAPEAPIGCPIAIAPPLTFTISSINGQKGQAGQVNYSASKAGDIGFTKALAQEGARAGITANVIAPGYIGTEMVREIDEKVLNERILPQIPVGRLGEPDEIARAVLFLASDEGGFITGSTLSINGGQYFP